MTKYDPEIWLESSTRCLKEYLVREFQATQNSPWEIVAEFPGPMLDVRKMPMHRTVIHFSIDDIQSNLIGFGDNVFSYTFDPVEKMLVERTGELHLLNFDVGIWASDASGGTTSRMRAKQILQSALGGARGIKRLREFSNNDDGKMEIISFSGGRFIADKIGDMPVHRMADCNLIVRVFSRDPLTPDMKGPAIMEIDQDPHLWVREGDGLVTVEPLEPGGEE